MYLADSTCPFVDKLQQFRLRWYWRDTDVTCLPVWLNTAWWCSCSRRAEWAMLQCWCELWCQQSAEVGRGTPYIRWRNSSISCLQAELWPGIGILVRFSVMSGQKLVQHTLNVFLSLPRQCCLAVAVCKSSIGQKGGALFPVSCFHGNCRNTPGVKWVAELPIAILVVLSAFPGMWIL